MPNFDDEHGWSEGFISPLTAGKPKGDPGAPVANARDAMRERAAKIDPLGLVPGGAGSNKGGLVPDKSTKR